MKVLAAADVHGKRAVYEWLIVEAREHVVDALILAGDLLGCPDGFESPEASQRHDAEALARLLERSDLLVLYVMGNDDLVDLNPASARVQSVHGRRVQHGRFGFVGYQDFLPFMGGVSEKPEADIAADLAGLAAWLDADTVVVSHSPAYGVLDPGFDDARVGSRSLGGWLAAHPYRAHIHGHSHAGFGRSGPHFNVASAGRARAMLIDFATMEHRVLGTGPQESEAQHGAARDVR